MIHYSRTPVFGLQKGGALGTLPACGAADHRLTKAYLATAMPLAHSAQ